MSAAFFRALARDASQRYPRGDRYARHFAYGKLTGDPAFAHLLASGSIPAHARILDLGCGQGLLAALLASACARHAAGDWPAPWPAPPDGWKLRGIDLSARDIERARHAGGPTAEFVAGDIRALDFGRADTVVILDVLHYIGREAQGDVLRRVRVAMGGGGVLLLRVADASRGLRFRFTVAVDRIVTALRGHGVGALHTMPLADWKRLLAGEGFRVEAVPMSAGTPFANVLLAARYDSHTPRPTAGTNR